MYSHHLEETCKCAIPEVVSTGSHLERLLYFSGMREELKRSDSKSGAFQAIVALELKRQMLSLCAECFPARFQSEIVISISGIHLDW